IWTQIGTFNFEEIFQRIRAPLVDSHNRHAPLAGQFVRIDPNVDPNDLEKTRERYTVLKAGAAPSADTRVVLYPLHMDHWHNFKPGNTNTYIGPETYREDPHDPNYGTMPYWM